MVCVTKLGVEERAWLKQRAANGDKAAAERIRMVSEYMSKRNRAYREKKKTESTSDRQKAVAEWQEALKQSTDKQFDVDMDDDECVLSGKESQYVTSMIEYRSMLRADTSENVTEESLESDASPHSQSYIPAISSTTSSEDKVITEAEVNLKLEIVARKKVRAVLNKELVEIEKEMLDNEDEEAKLRLELLRVQRGVMKSE